MTNDRQLYQRGAADGIRPRDETLPEADAIGDAWKGRHEDARAHSDKEATRP